MASNDLFNQISIWEGQHIGDVTSVVKVDKEVLHCKLGRTGTFLNEKIVILPYDKIPLVINTLKTKFLMAFSKYLCCTFNGEEVILCKHKSGTLTLKEFSTLPYPFYNADDQFVMSEIQRCIVFRYLFFIPENDEDIYMHPLNERIYCTVMKKITVSPISKYEKTYDISNHSLPILSIAKYFKSDNELFYQKVIEVIGKKSADDIKNIMINIIDKYDDIDKHMNWIDAVYNHVKQYI